MRELTGRVAILTGASRGLGVHIARALAKEGVHLALAARSEGALQAVRAEMEALGVKAIAVTTDVCDLSQLEALVARCEADLGPPDLPINNAGVENASAYEALSAEDLDRYIDVNLRAPMQLSRLVLGGMVQRNRGHIVNIASIAGFAATAFAEPYAATKHGIVGFTKSLRASEQASGSAVSASAVCPGYIRDEGMYAVWQEEGARGAPALLGTSRPEQVAVAVVRAIKEDLPDIIVNPGVPRFLFALSVLLPRLAEWVSFRIGAHAVIQSAAGLRGKGR